jgi:hypothetical protein
MKEDLDKERKAIMKKWAKREEQIERVMEGTVGCMAICRVSPGRHCKRRSRVSDAGVR